MLAPTSRPRRLREWEEETNNREGIFTADDSAETPAKPSISSLVLPSTEIPPPTHPEQIPRVVTTNIQGSLESQKSERDKALAAWTDIFGDQQGRQANLGHADKVPLQVVRHLGRGGGGSVDETNLGGVALAWKRISTRARRLTDEEMNEVKILGGISKRRHRHVVELIGWYIHKSKSGIELGMLIWPVAHCDLGHFLQDVDYLGDSLQEPANGNVTPDDLESVMDNLYPLISEGKPSQKHPEDRQYRQELYRRALAYLSSKVGCIGQAVAYLHQSGIRHKDLKPAQVLLSGSGLWLTDFGWSRDISQLTNSVTSGGHEITLKYHAPERTAGRPCGRPEDIFALGCIFLEIGYRLMRKDPRTTDIRLPWAAKKSFSASLEDIDSWIAPFIDQPHEPLQHFGRVIKQMLHIDPKHRPSIAGVLEMLSMPYRKPGSTKISNPFIASCCVPVRWGSFCDMNGVLVPQRLRTVVDPIARKIIYRWVKQSHPLSRKVNKEASRAQKEYGSMAGLYYLSEDEDMSDTDSIEEKEPHEDRERLDESLLGLSSSDWRLLPQVVIPQPEQRPAETSTDFFYTAPPPQQWPFNGDFPLYDTNHNTTPAPVGWRQQYWPPGTMNHTSTSQVDGSPYEPSLNTENSIEGIPTYGCGMTIYPVHQLDGSISVEAYYPPEYPGALRGRQLGTLEKHKALELLERANNEPVKLVPVTRHDGRRSVTPAPPSPIPERRASEENPGALWGAQVGNSQPQSVSTRRVSIDRQYLAPNDSGLLQISKQPENPLPQGYTSAEDVFPGNYHDPNVREANRALDYVCIYCGTRFATEGERDSHKLHVHWGLSPVPRIRDRRPVGVSNINLESTRRSPSLGEDSESLKCGICGLGFTGSYRRGNLARHQRQKHEVRTTSFPCEEEGCSRVYSRAVDRRKHYKHRHPHLFKASPSPRR